MSELGAVRTLTAAGVLAVAFGAGLLWTEWRFRQTAVRTTGAVAVTPEGRLVFRYEIGGREVDRPIDGRHYDEELRGYAVGTGVPVLCDPDRPATFETVRNNTAGLAGGVLFLALGAAFTAVGVASLRYLSKSGRGPGEPAPPDATRSVQGPAAAGPAGYTRRR